MAARTKRNSTDTHTCRNGLGANELSILAILTKEKKPLTAYDLIPLIGKHSGNAVAPVTVYRALQHLMAHNVVSRIESKNAYVLCKHPDEEHDCLFFICRQCGVATESPNSKISRLLRQEAESLGFSINKQILEVLGSCKACVKAQG